MDAHTLQVLEFDKVLALLAARTRSDAARRKSLALSPTNDVAAASRALRLAREKEFALAAGFQRPWERLPDLATALKRLPGGGRLDPDELLELKRQLAAARLVRSFFVKEAERYPLSAEEAGALSEHRSLERAIEATLADDGTVLDTASPALQRIRRERETVRQELQQKLARILRSSAARDALQEELVTIRGDRMVVPVRIDRQSRIPGIVHDVSGSGQTVFVEPLPTVPLNNRLRELAREEEEEIERILRRLAALALPLTPELLQNGELLAEFDLDFAKAEFSRDLRCTEPHLRTDGEVRIVAGRHPLLFTARQDRPGEEIVPLNFSLERGRQAILITGPNTGGKTVALKTVGLFTLMAQAGIPVPARDGTELTAFGEIFADVGDEQSIELDLSTFSSHLREIGKVLDRAGPSSLVLLDEVGAGTDPEEGSALAQAVLEHLLDRGVHVVATTHHNTLKMMAHLDPRMENGSMEFDPETLSPTFEFRQGIPGSSRGLDIARRLGLPARTVDRARGLLGKDRVELDRLLSDLDRELARAREEREGLEKAHQEAEGLRERLGAEEETLRRESRTHRRAARREAEAVLEEARALVERVVKEIRTQGATKESVVAARGALAELRQRLEGEEEDDRRAERGVSQSPGANREIRPGASVRLLSLERNGVVLDPPSGGKVRVQTGNIRLELPVGDVRLLDDEREEATGRFPGARGAGEGPRSGVSPGGVDVTSETEGQLLGEVDLRGLTAEEALEVLDRHLDGALLAGYPQVRIIHGKGSGVLRARVSAYLGRHPRVASFRLGEWNEGGLGVTVALLS